MDAVNLALNVASSSLSAPEVEWFTKNETGLAMSSCIIY